MAVGYNEMQAAMAQAGPHSPLHEQKPKSMNTILEKAYPAALKKARGITVLRTSVPDTFQPPKDRSDMFVRELMKFVEVAKEAEQWEANLKRS